MHCVECPGCTYSFNPQNNYNNYNIIKIPVWYGIDKDVIATSNKNVAVTLNKTESLKIVRVLARYDEPIAAPIKQGQQIGEIIVEYNI